MPVKISVVTATWNCAATVSDCLRSVAEQTHSCREHIVVDGASTDGTVGVLQSNAAQLSRWMSEPDRGIYDALNKGIALATGDVVGFLHADDVYASTEVLAHVAAVFDDPAVSAVYGDLQYVRKDDISHVVRHWKSQPFSRQRLAWGWMPPHPTFYVRRAVYARLGSYDTSYQIAADYDCMLRFLGRGGIRAAYIPEVLVKMRVGGASNRSLKNILHKSREDYRALKANGIGGLWALTWKNLSKLPQFLG